jgi:hypothetical protein
MEAHVLRSPVIQHHVASPDDHLYFLKKKGKVYGSGEVVWVPRAEKEVPIIYNLIVAFPFGP